MNTNARALVSTPGIWLGLAVAALLAASAFWAWGDGGRASAGALPTVGDVDCNDRVESTDAALILQYNAGLIASLSCPHNAQVSGDTQITAIDASLILQYTAALIDHLPPLLSFSGTVTTVRGVEADCLAINTGTERLVLLDPSGLSVGDWVSVIGFMDPYASFCGISPLLHNTSIESIVPLNSPTPRSTSTPTPTPTPSPTATSTEPPMPTPTETPMETPSPTASPPATEPPTETPSPTALPTSPEPTLPPLPTPTLPPLPLP